MIKKELLENAVDQDGLVALLSTSESEGGLSWPVDTDDPFTLEPEIAKDVGGGAVATVFRLIPPSEDETRLILLAEFDRPYVRRDLRELLTSLRKHIRTTGRFPGTEGIGDTYFIVVSPAYEDIRFVLFEERERRLPRIRSFGWRKEFVGRTVLTHNLERLKWHERAAWERAWDVEALTEEFYNEFVRVFDEVKAATNHPGGDALRHAYIQQLLDRLLFIAFIERMGWLRTPGTTGSTDYLHTLWLRHKALKAERRSYQSLGLTPELAPNSFHSLLRKLFFQGLDESTGISDGHRLYPLLGEVPYLNGGLFSEEQDVDHNLTTVEDDVFELILGDKRPGFDGGLFRRFNFTVTESTPLDQEVAVDPEMLGKIFERLIIAEERHRSGTYYTPRPIVEFMVNEALKGYLTERGLPAEKSALLVDEDKVESDTVSFKPSEMQDTLDWLFEVRAVDPACGSGAYLLMLLQRLFELVDRLEVVRSKKRDPNQKHLYDTKLRLLERCIYGVDLSEVAVRIARLRLWLSLVVENRGEKPEPLPNFDFLIMHGDSLASPLFPTQGVLGYPHDAIKEYTLLKRQYFHPAADQSRPSRELMDQKRAEIGEALKDELASSNLRKLSVKPFDWEVDFAEVFDTEEPGRTSGFDIALANPPYVNSGELLRSVGQAYKQALVSTFPHTSTGTVDLLVYFYDRALQLLRPGGQLSFITSNKWLKASYGQKLRGHVARSAKVKHLVDFRDLPVFQNVIAYPLVTIAEKREQPVKGNETPKDEARMTSVYTLDPPFPDVSELVRQHSKPLLPGALGVDGTWTLETGAGADRIAAMRKKGTPLGDYVKGRVYRGLLTGLNEVRIDPNGRIFGKGDLAPSDAHREGVFIIDGAKRAELLAQDPKSDEIIKPLAIGRDVRRWTLLEADRWLIVTKIGTDMNRYPAVMRHLQRFREKLIPRADQGEHWWELRACAYYSEFDKPKIVYQEIAGTPGFGWDDRGRYLNNKVFMLPDASLFLLALLNSSIAWTFWRSISTIMVGGAVAMQTPTVLQLPVPEPSEQDRVAIEALVQQILDLKSKNPDADVRQLEAEIDRRVEFLYFGDEVGRTYDEGMGRQREEVRVLLRKHAEDATLEFKETLWWDVKQGQYNNDRVLDVAKAICAMANRDGGTILIGVADEGNRPVGIAKDLEKLETPDKFQRKIAEPFGSKLRPDPSDLIRVGFIDLDGALICRVDVKPDRSTIYHLNEKVYVRRDGESREILGSDLAYWWLRRRQGEA